MNAPFEWGDELAALTGQRVALRAIERADAPALLRVFGDPEVMRYWSGAPMAGIHEADALIDDIHAQFAARTAFQWGIVERGGAEVIGTCTLFHLDRNHRRAEVGYILGRAHWGRGLAGDAVATLIEFAFDRLGLHRLEADADPENERSIRLLERQGFRREGLLRERWQVAGEVRDGAFFGLLAPEWTRARRREAGRS